MYCLFWAQSPCWATGGVGVGESGASGVEEWCRGSRGLPSPRVLIARKGTLWLPRKDCRPLLGTGDAESAPCSGGYCSAGPCSAGLARGCTDDGRRTRGEGLKDSCFFSD